MFNFFNTTTDEIVNYNEILGELQEGKAKLIDIRERAEWDQIHFKEALNLPLSELAKGRGVKVLKQLRRKNQKLYFHCYSGSRVGMAKRILSEFGCNEFSIIPVGMHKMAEAGFIAG